MTNATKAGKDLVSHRWKKTTKEDRAKVVAKLNEARIAKRKKAKLDKKV